MFNAGWIYGASFMAAAEELSRHPELGNDYMGQCRACAKHGIFLDQMSDEELAELYELAESYGRI